MQIITKFMIRIRINTSSLLTLIHCATRYAHSVSRAPVLWCQLRWSLASVSAVGIGDDARRSVACRACGASHGSSHFISLGVTIKTTRYNHILGHESVHDIKIPNKKINKSVSNFFNFYVTAPREPSEMEKTFVKIMLIFTLKFISTDTFIMLRWPHVFTSITFVTLWHLLLCDSCYYVYFNTIVIYCYVTFVKYYLNDIQKRSIGLETLKLTETTVQLHDS